VRLWIDKISGQTMFGVRVYHLSPNRKCRPPKKTTFSSEWNPIGNDVLRRKGGAVRSCRPSENSDTQEGGGGETFSAELPFRNDDSWGKHSTDRRELQTEMHKSENGLMGFFKERRGGGRCLFLKMRHRKKGNFGKLIKRNLKKKKNKKWVA